jgi:hypothetical protein
MQDFAASNPTSRLLEMWSPFEVGHRVTQVPLFEIWASPAFFAVPAGIMTSLIYLSGKGAA